MSMIWIGVPYYKSGEDLLSYIFTVKIPSISFSGSGSARVGSSLARKYPTRVNMGNSYRTL